MSKRGTKRKVATNIWEDEKRYIAIAKVGKLRREKRFPKTTAIRKITEWMEDTRRELRRTRAVLKRRRGTLAGDVAAYVGTLPKGRARNNTASCLAAWLAALGDVKRQALTRDRLQQVINDWIEAGVAASSIKHRRRALAQMLEHFDGEAAALIARKLRVPREPDPEPRAIDMDVALAIIDGMDEMRTVRHPGRGGRGFRNRAQARLRMMLSTGIAPASLMRLRPHDIDLERETITLPPRRKGRGAPAVTLPLFPEGVRACQLWLRAFAWGRFDQRALGKSFHAAVRAYVAREAAQGRMVTLPADLRPYDLRHSFLSWLWTETEDSLLVQHYGQHLDLKTTRRYTQGAVDPRIRAVVDRVRAKQLVSAVGPPREKTG